MKKMIIIEECWDLKKHLKCSHLIRYRFYGVCEEKNKVITEYNKIPSWCPLQDAPEEEK